MMTFQSPNDESSPPLTVLVHGAVLGDCEVVVLGYKILARDPTTPYIHGCWLLGHLHLRLNLSSSSYTPSAKGKTREWEAQPQTMAPYVPLRSHCPPPPPLSPICRCCLPVLLLLVMKKPSHSAICPDETNMVTLHPARPYSREKGRKGGRRVHKKRHLPLPPSPSCPCFLNHRPLSPSFLIFIVVSNTPG